MHNCTLPVTSAEAERSFRCVKLIKTHLRTNLSLLSLHSDRDRVNALDLDRVIDMFAVLSYTALCLNFKHVEFIGLVLIDLHLSLLYIGLMFLF